MKIVYTILLGLLLLSHDNFGQDPEVIATKKGDLYVYPINHATFVLQLSDLVIYFDPNGGKAAFEGLKDADLIFITDIHGDHFNKETLTELKTNQATFVVPNAVAEKMSDIERKEMIVIDNGESKTISEIPVTALPMYNLPETKDSRHPKGRGNGYILEIGGKRIYVSGDSEDIPEMRQLENIDVAFVCMNMPYTMTVEQAADAINDFKPAIVFPYHYRGQNGLSDVEKFKNLVNSENEDTLVILKDWYPEMN